MAALQWAASNCSVRVLGHWLCRINLQGQEVWKKTLVPPDAGSFLLKLYHPYLLPQG
jgi:hypothetical protein